MDGWSRKKHDPQKSHRRRFQGQIIVAEKTSMGIELKILHLIFVYQY